MLLRQTSQAPPTLQQSKLKCFGCILSFFLPIFISENHGQRLISTAISQWEKRQHLHESRRIHTINKNSEPGMTLWRAYVLEESKRCWKVALCNPAYDARTGVAPARLWVQSPAGMTSKA